MANRWFNRSRWDEDDEEEKEGRDYPREKSRQDNDFGRRQNYQEEGRFGRGDMDRGGRGEGTGHESGEHEPYRWSASHDRDYGYGRYRQGYGDFDEDYGQYTYRRQAPERDYGSRESGAWETPDRYRPGEDRSENFFQRESGNPPYGPSAERGPWRDRRYQGGGYGSGYGPGSRFDREEEERRQRSSNPWEVAGPHSGHGPEGYKRSDERIHEEICERLTRHGRLDARKIHIEVKQGEVTLRGQVESRSAKRMAEETADSVAGVVDVNNELRILPEGSSGQTGQNQASALTSGPAAGKSEQAQTHQSGEQAQKSPGGRRREQPKE